MNCLSIVVTLNVKFSFFRAVSTVHYLVVIKITLKVFKGILEIIKLEDRIEIYLRCYH